jgi:anaerobic magnesium-protoporphyrin IX monomethyl ester cyclase
MSARNVAFVAFQDQPNLGIGYLASVLADEGFQVEVLDYRKGFESILERVRELDPLFIGLSVIFQHYTPDFANLVAHLRENGITCPICAGGHYPSLESGTCLKEMPGLDFIVRFEGEQTLLEIARQLRSGRNWRSVPGIAYLNDGTVVETPLRPLIPDLDSLPFPTRWGFDLNCLGIRATSILASRGCPRNCSFCSIRMFYSIPPGPVRRTRTPENVIAEMEQLYRDQKVRIFLFQDDDFSLMSKRDRAWTWRFLDCLDRSEMKGNVAWKISCRSDEVEPEIFTAMRDAGLMFTYLGIESGHEAGLRVLNKNITVAQNLQAVKVLKTLGISLDFGFMLFDPSSTIDRVLKNTRFVKRICGDGSAPVSFAKTLPYAGTDLESQMKKEGRLRGDVGAPDYSFLDRRTEEWFEYLCEVFYPWVYGGQSLQAQLRWAAFEMDVLDRFYAHAPGLEEHKKRVHFLTHWYNEIYCRIIEDSSSYFRASRPDTSQALAGIRSASEQQRNWIEDQLAIQRRDFFTDAKFPLEIVLGNVA